MLSFWKRKYNWRYLFYSGLTLNLFFSIWFLFRDYVWGPATKHYRTSASNRHMKRWLEAEYYEKQQDNDDGDNSYYNNWYNGNNAEHDDGNDNEQRNNENIDDRFHYYQEVTKEKFWEIFNSPASDWTSDQWGFFAAMMTLFGVCFCCFCITCIVPRCCRRPAIIYGSLV